MAETKGDGKTKRFLKSLIQTSKGEGKNLSVADEDGCFKIEEEEEIRKVIVRAIEEHLPVQIQLNDEQDAFTYYTYFERQNDTTLYLEDGRYALLGALDPPVGNIKVRNATFVFLQMFTELHLVRTKVRFQKIFDQKIIQIGFPRYLQQEPQKRATVRASIESRWPFSLDIIRQSGVKFTAKPFDLSTGGCAFYYSGKIPKITEGSRVDVVVHWPQGAAITVEAAVIGPFSKAGHSGYRLRFLVGSYDLARQLEEVVTLAQRMKLKKRTKMFGS
uniref:PilZ domain-containing protein n=1 Tax=Magnetococcus massalia (strain MO-1) TaxID=451514 RepID=A0A1S7LEP8_MAGMO|nr:conserved protein of unknown function with a pilZ domain [Candidatus Magnetococcus massalia]